MKKVFQWYQVKALDDTDIDYEWLLEIMGEPDYTARWWYEQSTNNYYFRKESDAIWFTLKWSHNA